MKLSGEFLKERVITITKGFYYWAIRMVQHENQLGNITKKNEYLGINLTTEVKDLYNETQILMKEIKEGTTQWKDMFMNQKT